MRDFKFFFDNEDRDSIPIPDGYNEYQAAYFRFGWRSYMSGEPIHSCTLQSELNKRLWEYGWTEAYHYRERLLTEIANNGF